MNILFSSSTALHISALGGLQVQAGLLVTVNTMSALIIRPVSGVLSDKIGRVKLLITGAIMCSIGCIL
jgi:MFS family permease